MQIRFDSPDLIDLRNRLYEMARKGVPHAGRNALNRAAFATREQWQRQIYFDLTTRNAWTARSIQVDQARGLDVARMEATVGSAAPYMRTQEEGGVEQKQGKHGVAVPTPVASGEGRGARPRRRMVRGPNKLPNIQLTARIGGTQKQRNAIAISGALRTGRRHVFLETENKKGLFRISGGKRRPKIDMVWDLTKPSVRIPATPTLQPALQAVQRRLPDILVRTLLEQLQRHRVVGFRD